SEFTGNGISSPCGNGVGDTLQYGQTEDYGIYFLCSGDTAISNFGSDTTYICLNDTIKYVDSSINAFEWDWDFGAGAFPSTAKGPGPHNVGYTTTGLKTIRLAVEDSCDGPDTLIRVNYITVIDSLPVAGFFSDTSIICVTDTITYTDSSSHAIGWSWDFGSGAVPATASTLGPHAVTYSTSGNKTIQLIINGTGTCGSNDTLIKTNYVNAVSNNPISGFTADLTTACINTNVQYTDGSTNAVTWSWDFGSGASPATASGSGPHDVTYSTAGTKTIQLIVGACGGFDTLQRVNYVTIINPAAPVADFTVDTTQQCRDDTVTFTDASTTAASWSWDFGSGALPATSTSSGPIAVTYSTTGSKTISLVVVNACGAQDTIVKTGFVTIIFNLASPNFGADTLSQCLNDTVVFTDSSVNTSTWSWDFGAAASPATANTQGPHSVAYSTKGTKTISLTASNSCHQDVLVRTNYINVIDSFTTAHFTVDTTAQCINDTVIFSDSSVNATGWLWDFGPGSTPATASTSGPHSVVYSTAGSKSVSLNISGNGICQTIDSTTLSLLTIVDPPVPVADYAPKDTTICRNNTITFYDSSSNAVSYQWDFGYGASPQTVNIAGPISITYTKQGFKDISLTVTNACGLTNTLFLEDSISVFESTSPFCTHGVLGLNSGDGMGIQRFQFNTIDNSS
ncbi:MAG: PKD domain-containing protein, partial [Bacteroidetes bacterium]|nr:PKD domain-containing protein [Bacteroidota bacterium]